MSWWNRWEPNTFGSSQLGVPTMGIDTSRHSASSEGAVTPQSSSQSAAGLSQLGPCFLCGNIWVFKKSCPLWAQLRAEDDDKY